MLTTPCNQLFGQIFVTDTTICERKVDYLNDNLMISDLLNIAEECQEVHAIKDEVIHSMDLEIKERIKKDSIYTDIIRNKNSEIEGLESDKKTFKRFWLISLGLAIVEGLILLN